MSSRRQGCVLMDDLDVFEFLVKRVIMPPGQWVLEQVGDPRPTEVASLVTGSAFWAFVVFLVFALVLGW